MELSEINPNPAAHSYLNTSNAQCGIKHIIVSRTDSIGDVVLTLPLCGVLKQRFPGVKITFLARTYTIPIIKVSEHVDEVINWDEMQKTSPNDQIKLLRELRAQVIIHVFPRKEIIWLAKRALIPWRIATGRRWHTLMKCNKLVFHSRKKSVLHESQLNIKLLSPLGIREEFTLEEISKLYGMKNVPSLPEKFKSLLDPDKKHIIIHPKSKGSAVEWPLSSWKELIETLAGNDVQVFITGTADEKKWISSHITWPQKSYLTDLSGSMSLDELIAFIAHCDVLIAASTGPLHIASALGIKAIGLYSPKRPIHPGRWAPVGINASYLVAAKHPLKGEGLGIGVGEVVELI